MGGWHLTQQARLQLPRQVHNAAIRRAFEKDCGWRIRSSARQVRPCRISKSGSTQGAMLSSPSFSVTFMVPVRRFKTYLSSSWIDRSSPKRRWIPSIAKPLSPIPLLAASFNNSLPHPPLAAPSPIMSQEP